MSDVFTEKYRPNDIKHFIGNEQAVQVTKHFFLSWKNKEPMAKALLFYGPPGIGKTSLALLLAKSTGQSVIHHNASDLTKKSDMQLLLSTSKMGTIDDSEMRIVIVDECDRISNAGQKIMIKVIEDTRQPLILICNDIAKMSGEVKSRAMSVVFTMIPEYLIRKRIEQIARMEKVDLPEGTILDILKYNNTVRGAVNSLQDYIQCGIVSDTTRDPDLTEKQKLEMILCGTKMELHLNLDQVNRWLVDSELDDYQVPCDLDLILKRIQETQDYSLDLVGYKVAGLARGKLCSFPMSFNSIHRANNQLRKNIKVEENRDNMIKLGNRKSKKKDASMPEYEDKRKNDNTTGLEEFI